MRIMDSQILSIALIWLYCYTISFSNDLSFYSKKYVEILMNALLAEVHFCVLSEEVEEIAYHFG